MVKKVYIAKRDEKQFLSDFIMGALRGSTPSYFDGEDRDDHIFAMGNSRVMESFVFFNRLYVGAGSPLFTDMESWPYVLRGELLHVMRVFDMERNRLEKPLIDKISEEFSDLLGESFGKIKLKVKK